MSLTYFHRYRNKRYAALFALFAMALIIVAPLISVSLQKDPMAAMGHEMATAGGHHAMDHRSADPPAAAPADHAEACGYCVLFAHVPALLAALVLLLCLLMRRIRLRIPPPLTACWLSTPRLRPETRAPPVRPA